MMAMLHVYRNNYQTGEKAVFGAATNISDRIACLTYHSHYVD